MTKLLAKSKIKTKLMLIGIFTILIFIVIEVVAIASLHSMTKNATDSSDKYTKCLEQIYTINDAFGKENIEVRNIIWIYDPKERVKYIDAIHTYMALINQHLERYEDCVLTGRFEELKTEETKLLSTLKENIKEFETVKDKIINLVENNENDQAQSMYDEIITPLTEKTGETISFMYNINLKEARLVSSGNEASGNLLTIIISIVSGIFIVLLYIFLYLVNKSITAPMAQLIQMSSDIANGDLDKAFAFNYGNEVGILSQNFNKMIDTFKSMLQDIDSIISRQNKGEINCKIAVEKYEGAYKKVGTGLNNLITNYNEEMERAVSCVSEFGQGNFDAELKEFPGEKTYINHAIEAVRINLKDVTGEISQLTQMSIQGQLSARTNQDKYQGDWNGIMKGINGLLDTITDPMKEASEVLQEVSRGNLSVKVVGTYTGDNAKIKNALNQTIDSISLYISDISEVLYELANDNYNVYIDREYLGDFGSIKDSISLIVNKLNDLVGEITLSSGKVDGCANDVYFLSNTLEQSSENQSEYIQSLTATMEALYENTEDNAVAANKANEMVVNTRTRATKGAEEMSAMLESMDQINTSSNNISKVIKVIEDISFQTNLLALNASVEAARAGIHGKGFAVVAEEVRNLAGRSKNAANETSVMINDSIIKVKEGISNAHLTSEALNEIINGVTEVSATVSTIAKASRKQQTELLTINKTIADIADVTKVNTDAVEKSSSAVTDLKNESQALNEMMKKFTLK